MEIKDIFLNQVGRLRSGWRLVISGLLIFVFTYIAIVFVGTAVKLILGPDGAAGLFDSRWGFVIQGLTLLTPATLIGWACGKLFEDLPPRALGWGFTRGWLKDFFIGSLIGAASLLLATAFPVMTGSLKFTVNAPLLVATIGKTVLTSIPIFIIAAAAEEAIFRGYPLQTMARSHLAWVSIIITSIIFSSGHLDNPNVVPGFTFANTAIAGAWLAVAYLKTRNLWFPLGIHWAWNWTMAAVMGLPVSGITRLTPDPLLRATDTGPAWITGGTYGIEGGAACTLALILSTIFIWRTRRVSAQTEMLRLTDQENPQRAPQPLSIFEPSAGEN
jgi:membrane protease YdiL (CAAX protease family)